MPRRTAAVSAHVLCAPYNHVPVYNVKSCKDKHVYRVHLCLAVTYHLYLWQNDRDVLRATAVTRGWNGYRNETQHRNLTLEKNFSRCSYLNSNPRPPHHESITLPQSYSSSPQKVCYSGVPLVVTNARAFLR